jgi:DNA-binding transcriptional LysR family regulator
VGGGGGGPLAPRLGTGAAPAGVVFRELADPVLRTVSAVTRHGADRHPAVRVVLDHLAAAARDQSVHSGPA